MATRVVLVDDHPFARIGTRLTLAAHPDIEVVGEAGNPVELRRLLDDGPSCDVLVTDLAMPVAIAGDEPDIEPDGIDMVRRVRRERPALGIVVLTGAASDAIVRSIVECETVSLLHKRDPLRELVDAVRAARAGRVYFGTSFGGTNEDPRQAAPLVRLSPREAEVVALFASGLSVTAVARLIGRDIRTVSRQKRDAMAKLGVRNDPGLFAYAWANGLCERPNASRADHEPDD